MTLQLIRSTAKEPRWYQGEALVCVRRELGLVHGRLEQAPVNRTLVEMATGLGKTVLFTTLAAEWPGRVLILAHRDELVDQAKAELESATGEWVQREKAQWQADLGTRLVVGSVQTMQSAKRLARYPRDHFSLIIVDECHHATAPSYRKILDHFESARCLGVTATPDRGDGMALGQVFQSVAYSMGIEAGIEHGYLVPIVGRRVFLDEIDLSEVKTSAGDLQIGQLDEKMLKAAEGICRKLVELAEDRQTILFLPGVKSAQYATQKLNVLKPDSATLVVGSTESEERKGIVRGFRKQSHQFLVGVGVPTEGFDVPQVSCVALGRPTKSRALFAQMAGRGTRTLPGVVDDIPFAEGKEDGHVRRAAIAASGKKELLLLDFVGNSGKHSLCSVEDILGGKYTEEERAAARKRVLDRAENTQAALEAARRELRQLAEAQAAQVRARVEEWNPFKAAGFEFDADKYAIKAGYKPLRPELREKLVKYGFPAKRVDALSQQGGEALWNQVRARSRLHLATPRQLAALRQYGINDPNVSFANAHRAMDYLLMVPRNRVVPATLDAIVYGRREPGMEG